MTKCSNCGFEESNEEILRKEDFNEFMKIVLKRSEIRMEKQMGYGIPETTQHEPENLGSVITGEWRKDDNQKDN